MLRKLMFGAVVCMSGVALAAPDAKDEVVSGAKKLADASNYSWKQTTEGGFGAGEQTGKHEKDGFTLISMTFGDNAVQLAKKGDKAVIKVGDEGWKTPEELAGAGGGDGQPNPAMFITNMVRSLKAPGDQAQETTSKLKTVEKDGDVYKATLTGEDASAAMPRFGGRRGGGGGGAPPQLQNGKIELKMWAKDGVLSKYTMHVTGNLSFNGNDIDVDRTTTVEISDVGSTKVEIPDDAKKKLQ